MDEQVIALVVAFNTDGELLLLKRPDDAHQGGLWSLPGGKVDEGETPLDAAVRELREETGLAGKYWRHLGKFNHSYPDRTLHFLLFVCICPDIKKLAAESEAVWTSLASLHRYPMPAANEKLLPHLQLPEVAEYLREFSAAD